jgi:hypothetical protein
MATKVDFIARLESVTEMIDGKFCFKVKGRAGGMYRFLLSAEKALKVANKDSEFPSGVDLHITGRATDNVPSVIEGGRARTPLNYVKIHSVDGHELQAWAERNQSPTVVPDVLRRARKTIADARAEEEAMKRRAPPDPPPRFKSAKAAYEEGMQCLRRQAKLKDPKLSKSEIWIIRDALNMLKEAAGL